MAGIGIANLVGGYFLAQRRARGVTARAYLPS